MFCGSETWAVKGHAVKRLEYTQKMWMCNASVGDWTTNEEFMRTNKLSCLPMWREKMGMIDCVKCGKYHLSVKCKIYY